MTTVNENDLEKSIGEKMKEFEKLKQEYAESLFLLLKHFNELKDLKNSPRN